MASKHFHRDRKPSVEIGSEEGEEITDLAIRLAVGRQDLPNRIISPIEVPFFPISCTSVFCHIP